MLNSVIPLSTMTDVKSATDQINQKISSAFKGWAGGDEADLLAR